jgi:transposase
MMGRLNHEQEQFFYSFRLDDAVPGDHPVRRIAAVLDLGWVYSSELAPYYPKIGRPSVNPVLMIRMLIVGYVFGIRSERVLCRDVAVNLAYRWFCGLSLKTRSPITRCFHVRAMSVFVTAAFSGAYSNALSEPVLGPAWSGARALRWMRA